MPDTVLVTGGAGFIGSHLSEHLLRCGYRVRVLDDLSFGRIDWVPDGAELIRGDIRDLETCHAACRGAVGVFHTAAMSRAGPSIEAVEICTQVNIQGTQNMLIAARDAGVRRFVYSGSSTYYGNRPGPHREDTPPEYLNFYALSKAVGEEYCRLFDRLFDLPTVILRYFNVYGPRQPEVGAYALVLGIFLRRWKEGRPLEIHGSGDQRRDFIHVRDVAAANVAAFASDTRHVAFNVGSGTNVSIKGLADLISPDQVFTPRRPGDAQITLADLSAIGDSLGWTPSISFEDGLEELKDEIGARSGLAIATRPLPDPRKDAVADPPRVVGIALERLAEDTVLLGRAPQDREDPPDADRGRQPGPGERRVPEPGTTEGQAAHHEPQCQPA